MPPAPGPETPRARRAARAAAARRRPLSLVDRTAIEWRARSAGRRRNLLWNFLAGLIFAVLVPSLLRSLVSPGTGGESLDNALLGTAAAALLGHYLYRSFANFPGVQGGSYILPSFAVAYGSVTILFFLLRLEYSRLQFVGSFVIAIAWYGYVFFSSRRHARQVIGILPLGQTELLCELPDIDWRRLSVEGDEAIGCDNIAADLHAPLPDEWERYLADHAIAGIPVLHFRQVQESLTGTVQIERLSENNLGSLLPERVYVGIKQLIDIAAAALVGVLLLPVLAVVAVLIRLDSAGPALFRQARVGFRGHPFTLYKFRTMRQAEPGAGAGGERDAAITRDRDDRITRLGRTLRRYRIDELPQIINILLGQMSWIGPRPEAVVLSQWYEEELPFYRYRHIVRPGITGWAQVNQGHVADMREVLGKLHYDFYYIKYFSPWLDLLIVMRTIRTMFTGQGAR